MNARLHWWLYEWDWRPMARLIVWLAIAAAAAERYDYHPPSLAAVGRELFLGWMLTFGLLTRVQIWLALAAIWAYMLLDDWTFAASEWLVRPVAGRAPFAVNFLAALAAQVGLVFAAIASLPWALTNISIWL